MGHSEFGLEISVASAANNKINVGFLGYGLIGKRRLLEFREQPDVHIVAVAEAHEGARGGG
jgi:hypothetical protein